MSKENVNSDSFLKQTRSQLLREQETLRLRREVLVRECAKPPAMRFNFRSPLRSRSHNSRSPAPELNSSKSQQGLPATPPPQETSMESIKGRSLHEGKEPPLQTRASRLRQPPMRFSLSYRPFPIAAPSHSLKCRSISPAPREANPETPTSHSKSGISEHGLVQSSRKRPRSRSHRSEHLSSQSQKSGEPKRRPPKTASVDVPVQIFTPSPKLPAATGEGSIYPIASMPADNNSDSNTNNSHAEGKQAASIDAASSVSLSFTPTHPQQESGSLQAQCGDLAKESLPCKLQGEFPLPQYSPSRTMLERFSSVLCITPDSHDEGGPLLGGFATPRPVGRLARCLSPLEASPKTKGPANADAAPARSHPEEPPQRPPLGPEGPPAQDPPLTPAPLEEEPAKSKSPAPTPQRVLASLQLLSEKRCRRRPASSDRPPEGGSPLPTPGSAALGVGCLRTDRPTPASLSSRPAAATARDREGEGEGERERESERERERKREGVYFPCSVSPLLTTAHIVQSIQISAERKREPRSNDEAERQGVERKDNAAGEPLSCVAKDALVEAKELNTPFPVWSPKHARDHGPTGGDVTALEKQPAWEYGAMSQALSVSSPVVSSREIVASVMASADKRRCQHPIPDLDITKSEGMTFESALPFTAAGSECASASPQITTDYLLESLGVSTNKPNRGGEPAMERCGDTISSPRTFGSEGSSGTEQAKGMRVSSPSPTDFQLQASLEASADKRNALHLQEPASNSPSRCTPCPMSGPAASTQTETSQYASPTQSAPAALKTYQDPTPTATTKSPCTLDEGVGAQPQVRHADPTSDDQPSEAEPMLDSLSLPNAPAIRKEEEDESRCAKKKEAISSLANSSWNYSGRDPFLDYAYLEEKFQTMKGRLGNDETTMAKGETQHALTAPNLSEGAVASVEKDLDVPVVNSETPQDCPHAGPSLDLSFLPPQFYQLEKDIKAISEGRLCSTSLPPLPRPTPDALEPRRSSVTMPPMKEGGWPIDITPPPFPARREVGEGKSPRRSSLVLAEGTPYFSCYTPLQEPHRPVSIPGRCLSSPPIQIPRTLAPPPPLPAPPAVTGLDRATVQPCPGASAVRSLPPHPARLAVASTHASAAVILPDSQRMRRASFPPLPRPVSLRSQVPPRVPSPPCATAAEAKGSGTGEEGEGRAPPAPRPLPPPLSLPISLSPREGRSTPYPRGSIVLTVRSTDETRLSDVLSLNSGDGAGHRTPPKIQMHSTEADSKELTAPRWGGEGDAGGVSQGLGNSPEDALRPSLGSDTPLQSGHPLQSIDPTPVDVSLSPTAPESLLQSWESGAVSGAVDAQPTPPPTVRHSGRRSKVDSLMEMLPNDVKVGIEQDIHKRLKEENAGEDASNQASLQGSPSSAGARISSCVGVTSITSDSIAQRIMQNPRKKERVYNYDSYLIYLSQLERTSAKKIRKKAGKRMQKRIERDVLDEKGKITAKSIDSTREGRATKKIKAEATETHPTPVSPQKVSGSKDNDLLVVSPTTPSTNSRLQGRKPKAASCTSGERREAVLKKGTPTKPTRRLFETPSTPSSRASLLGGEEKAARSSLGGSESTDNRSNPHGRPKQKKPSTNLNPSGSVKELYPSSLKQLHPRAAIPLSQKRTAKRTLVDVDEESQYSSDSSERSLRKKKKYRKGSTRFSNTKKNTL